MAAAASRRWGKCRLGWHLGGVATLLGAAVGAVALQKTDVRSRLIYLCLLGSVTVPASWLPIGLPWVGAHVRMDALAAVFLVII